ncbi:hypothetical protein CMI42_00930 [Candidatus Pacearchaeota archaeon]|nr:hypothetical protein [Candidatus Pacearchaeota archaeon]|tara:strand:- start:318 stop:512 length:195 start_codon:yes stop_codon:yes gene_type:complete
MADKKKKHSSRRETRKFNFIDGWGLILLIIGIAISILREDVRTIGIVVILIGIIRITYSLTKHG